MVTIHDLQKRIEELAAEKAKLQEQYDSKHKFSAEDSIKTMQQVEQFIKTLDPKALNITINGKEKADRYDSNVGDFILKYVKSEQLPERIITTESANIIDNE